MVTMAEMSNQSVVSFTHEPGVYVFEPGKGIPLTAMPTFVPSPRKSSTSMLIDRVASPMTELFTVNGTAKRPEG